MLGIKQHLVSISKSMPMTPSPRRGGTWRTCTDQACVDGVTVVQFQARLFANLKALQNTLMQQRYYPQPVKRIAIPKADGTRRPLGILSVTDRIVQRAVCLTIEPLFDAGFEECSHGFRRGRSVHTALDQVVRLINLGYAWFSSTSTSPTASTASTRRCSSRLFKPR